jgi:hypothetical protein
LDTLGGITEATLKFTVVRSRTGGQNSWKHGTGGYGANNTEQALPEWAVTERSVTEWTVPEPAVTEWTVTEPAGRTGQVTVVTITEALITARNNVFTLTRYYTV